MEEMELAKGNTYDYFFQLFFSLKCKAHNRNKTLLTGTTSTSTITSVFLQQPLRTDFRNED